MRQRFVLSGVVLCLVCFAALASSAGAQLPPVKNPLAPAQNPGAAGCSTADASSCAQVAAKLLPIVMGPSPMEENLRRLTDEVGGRVTGSPEMAKAVEWGVAAFRAAGIDVHTEEYTLPVTWREGHTALNITGPMLAVAKEARGEDGKIFVIMPGLRAVSEAVGPPTPHA